MDLRLFSIGYVMTVTNERTTPTSTINDRTQFIVLHSAGVLLSVSVSGMFRHKHDVVSELKISEGENIGRYIAGQRHSKGQFCCRYFSKQDKRQQR